MEDSQEAVAYENEINQVLTQATPLHHTLYQKSLN